MSLIQNLPEDLLINVCSYLTTKHALVILLGFPKLTNKPLLCSHLQTIPQTRTKIHENIFIEFFPKHFHVTKEEPYIHTVIELKYPTDGFYELFKIQDMNIQSNESCIINYLAKKYYTNTYINL
jgi:hypothetical protein